MWYDILTFVNFAGVLSNAFLIAFTSSWGQDFSLEEKLWIVIGFEVCMLNSEKVTYGFGSDANLMNTDCFLS